jgi:hypothetical protein
MASIGSSPAIGSCADVGGWSAGIIELANYLVFAPIPAVRERASEMIVRRASTPETAVRAEMFPMAVATLRDAAENLAAALGATTPELLDFSSPYCRKLALAGRFATKTRLDRTFGGSPLALVESHQTIHLPWYGPGVSRCFVIQGHAWTNGRDAERNQTLRAPAGSLIHVAAGTLILMRHPPIATFLEAAHNAGLDLEQLIALAGGVACETAIGPLKLVGVQAELGGRGIRLSKMEAEVLSLLMSARGGVVPRAALAAAGHVGTEKLLESVLVRLRDKFGDGLISTVRGSGCALEIKPSL